MSPIGAIPATPGPADSGADKLTRMKNVASQFEGVFVEQLFKAMRETVPQDGEMTGGAGEDVFTSLLDAHIASEAPRQWHRGVGDAIVAHLTAATDPGTNAVEVPKVLHSPAREAP